MASTKPPRWRKSFLAALARTGNVRAACDVAMVCHTYLYRYRKEDTAFAAAWDAALAAAGRSLASEREGGRPPARHRFLRGQAMEVIGGYGHRPPRLIAASARRFTPAKERAFLSVLASTANVRLAAAEAGVSTRACYWQRGRRPGFAQAWASALEMGIEAVEEQLVTTTLAALGDDSVIAPEPRPIVDFWGALALVSLHRKQRFDRPMRPGGRHQPKPMDPHEAAAVILRIARAVQRMDLPDEGRVTC